MSCDVTCEMGGFWTAQNVSGAHILYYYNSSPILPTHNRPMDIRHVEKRNIPKKKIYIYIIKWGRPKKQRLRTVKGGAVSIRFRCGTSFWPSGITGLRLARNFMEQKNNCRIT